MSSRRALPSSLNGSVNEGFSTGGNLSPPTPHQARELLSRSSGGFATTAEVKVESLVPGDDALRDLRLFPTEQRPRVVEI